MEGLLDQYPHCHEAAGIASVIAVDEKPIDAGILGLSSRNPSVPKSRMCDPQVRFRESWGRVTSPGYSPPTLR